MLSIATVIAVGFKMGNTTRQNVPSGEQPSIVAVIALLQLRLTRRKEVES